MALQQQALIYYIEGMENKYYLDENGIWQRIGNAFTDPQQRFEFPIKPIETDFTPQAKTALYLTAGILAAGAIITALIIKGK